MGVARKKGFVHDLRRLKARRGLTPVRLANMTRSLGILLKAGVVVPRALEILRDQEDNPLLRQILDDMMVGVMSGGYVSDCLALYPRIFTPMYVNMVVVGENIGDMPGMLERLAWFMERDASIHRRMRAAMVYPGMVFAVSLAVILILFKWVLPPMMETFAGMGQLKVIPFPTRVLKVFLAISNNVVLEVLAVFLIFIVCQMFVSYLKTPPGRLQFDTFKFMLPGIRNLERKLVLSRFSLTLSVLLKAGVPLMQSLKLLNDNPDNEYFRRRAIKKLYDGLEAGVPLPDLVGQIPLFPALVQQMVVAGENTGQLGERLGDVFQHYDEELTFAVEAFLQLIEPALIAFMGLLVGFIMIAVFAPLYEAINGLGIS